HSGSKASSATLHPSAALASAEICGSDSAVVGASAALDAAGAPEPAGAAAPPAGGASPAACDAAHAARPEHEISTAARSVRVMRLGTEPGAWDQWGVSPRARS